MIEICGDNLDNDCDGQVDEECCPKITSFTGSRAIIDPNAGGSVFFSYEVDQLYDEAAITINGQDIGGTNWDGTLNGVLVNPGTYTAVLTVKKGDCTVTDSTPVTVEEYEGCALKVTVGSSANVASGELTDSLPLFSTQGAGPSLSLSLHYGSLDGHNGPLGRGWSHSYDIFVTENTFGEVVLHEGNGSRKLYTPSGSGYLSQPGDTSILTRNADGTFTLTRKDGPRYSFRADGKIASITDRNGNALAFAYAGGLLQTVTDPAGRAVAFSYDASGKFASVTDPAGSVYSFTAGGSLTNVTFPDGGTWSYAYDADAFLTAKTDPAGYLTIYAYDGEHRVIESIDPEGRTRTISYPDSDETVRTTTFTEKDGGVWDYTYDSSAGDLLAKTDPEGNTVSYTYDAGHNTLSKTDADGSTTRYSYDAAGNMTRVTDPAGATTSYTYNAFGQTTSVTDPEGDVTRYEYDAGGNLVKTVDPTGAATAYEYDAKGNVTSVTDPTGATTRITYDAAGNLTSVTDPSGATTRFEYDAAGRMLRQSDPQGNATAFEYDARGNQIKVVDPLGNATSATFDAKGNKTSETDANGNTTRYEYNAQGQMVKMTDAEGFVSTFAYGGSGCPSCGGGGGEKLTAVTDAKGNATTFEYDRLGRLIREADPLGRETTYAYDVKGNLAAKTDANGNTVCYAYDGLGRLLKKSYPDGTEEAFTYDAKGNILTAANRHIGYSFIYDAAGRVTSVADSEGHVLGYEYNTAGRKTKMVAPDGKAIRYEYDAAGRLSTIRNGGDFFFGYDDLGRRNSLTFPNSVAATYSYDDAARLITIAHRNAAGEIVAQSAYTHDKVGNRLSKATEQRTTGYTYDKIYRLLQAEQSTPGAAAENPKGNGRGIAQAVQSQKEVYVYDPVGNRQRTDKVTSYTHDDANELLQAGGTSFRYDKNGNLIEKTSPEGTTTYAWDYENRLSRVVTPAGTEVEFKYDPFGRRIEKKVPDVEGVKVTRFVYDNEDILFETDETGAIGNRYIHGPGIDEPLALLQNRDVYYYHADGLGSVIALTDGRGKSVQNYEYDSYGNLHDQKNRIKQPYAYAGREWDKKIGLYFNRGRYYDSMEGRFISKDPIGFAGGDVNLYGYVQNNPIGWIDPWGLAGLWLEASSPGEPGPHQSIGFGDPLGGNLTLSFGVNPGESPFGGMGSVYQDINAGGEIEKYFDVPNNLAPAIEAELMRMYGNRDVYFIESNNCRHWSNDTLNSLVKKYSLQKTDPPNRKSTPTGAYPGGTSSQPTTNTGVWTTSPGPTM